MIINNQNSPITPNTKRCFLFVANPFLTPNPLDYKQNNSSDFQLREIIQYTGLWLITSDSLLLRLPQFISESLLHF